MSDVDIIAAEHIIVSAQYKSKDWTDKYLVPVEQYRALEKQLKEAQKECFSLAANTCESPYGDDYGNKRCKTIDDLRCDLADAQAKIHLMREALETLWKMFNCSDETPYCKDPSFGNNAHFDGHGHEAREVVSHALRETED